MGRQGRRSDQRHCGRARLRRRGKGPAHGELRRGRQRPARRKLYPHRRLHRYKSPQFYLSKPLRYGVGEDIQVRDRLGALDQIDGTISDRIKVSTDSLQTYYAGLYPVTVEVTNSLGDTASLTLDIEIYDSILGEPVIQLDRYLVYLDSAADFDPDSYISSVTGAPESSVRVSTPAGGLRPGVNRITYTCTGTNGLTGSTVLYAIIQK